MAERIKGGKRDARIAAKEAKNAPKKTYSPKVEKEDPAPEYETTE